MVKMKLNFFNWKPTADAPPPHSDQKTMVFLHGLGGTGQIWRPIAAQLEEEWNCIAPDQRGHGKSRPVPPFEVEHFHADDYAEDVFELLTDLKIKHYWLVGHSMGVRTALALAKRDPDRIKGVIAVDIGITSDWGGGIGEPLAQFIEGLPESFPSRTLMKEHLAFHCPDPAIAQYLSAVAIPSKTEPQSWSFPFDHQALIQTIYQAHHAPLADWLKEALGDGVPFLFLRGANSRFWLKSDYEEQKATLNHPLLRFEEWENCGHGLPFEQRARFIALLKTLQ